MVTERDCFVFDRDDRNAAPALGMWKQGHVSYLPFRHFHALILGLVNFLLQ